MAAESSRGESSMAAVEYIYEKGELVFAESEGHKPFPARVTRVDPVTGVYTVSFLGYKCTCKVLASMMQKFTPKTVAKYEALYRGTSNGYERTILRKIDIAKKIYLRQLHRTGPGKRRRRSVDAIDHLFVWDREQEEKENLEMPETKGELLILDSEERQPVEVVVVQDSSELDSEEQIILSNENQKEEEPKGQGKVEQLHKQQQPQTQFQKVVRVAQVEKVVEFRNESESTDELFTAQTFKSVPSLHFTPQDCLSKQTTPMRLQEKQKFPLEYLPEDSSDSESELEGEPLNVCSEVDVFDIDCPFDELQVADGDYCGMLRSMDYRRKKLSVISPQGLMMHLASTITTLLRGLARGRRGKACGLPMKQRENLMAILAMRSLGLSMFGECVVKMVEVAYLYEGSSLEVKQLYLVEYLSIRSKLNILRTQYRLGSSEREYSLFLDTAFRRYADLKCLAF